MWELLQDVKHFFKALGIEVTFILAGLFGALASVSKEKKMSFWEKFVSIIVGGAVSNYITPIVVSWISAGENTKYGIAFILGYTGLKSVEYIINKAKNKFDNKTE